MRKSKAESSGIEPESAEQRAGALTIELWQKCSTSVTK